jgi:aspartate/glutamate racemase
VKTQTRSAARMMRWTSYARSVDGIILGCTEIPLLLGDAAGASDLVNTLQLLAEAAVNHALNVTAAA